MPASRAFCALLLAIGLLAVVTIASVDRSYGGNVTRTVNTTNTDFSDGPCESLATGDCTLEEAINSVGGQGDRIEFDIPGTDPGCDGAGVCTITLEDDLPTLAVNGVVIDGYTQDGAQENTAGPGQPTNAVIKIVVDGSECTAGRRPSGVVCPTAFFITGDGNKIRGLAINNFDYYAVGISGGNNNVVEGNYLGVDPSGTTDGGNSHGVAIFSGLGNVVGGSSPAARNVISGNSIGVLFAGGPANTVIGNYIGTNAAGTGAIPNSRAF